MKMYLVALVSLVSISSSAAVVDFYRCSITATRNGVLVSKWAGDLNGVRMTPPVLEPDPSDLIHTQSSATSQLDVSNGTSYGFRITSIHAMEKQSSSGLPPRAGQYICFSETACVGGEGGNNGPCWQSACPFPGNDLNSLTPVPVTDHNGLGGHQYIPGFMSFAVNKSVEVGRTTFLVDCRYVATAP